MSEKVFEALVINGLFRETFYVASGSMPKAIAKAEQEANKLTNGPVHVSEIRCLGNLYRATK